MPFPMSSNSKSIQKFPRRSIQFDEPYIYIYMYINIFKNDKCPQTNSDLGPFHPMICMIYVGAVIVLVMFITLLFHDHPQAFGK